ncbi:MAG TPA: four helix bundle protein [Candidatus Omnitrophota bacterium]|nr:four helix bundle protein [Candidatus Omnitrophota bacterium]
MGEATYKRLLAWQKADELAKLVYLETKKFPGEELYGIVSQLRRAALSVPTNIVEGSGRNSKKELKRFLSISLGSLAEVEYLIDFSFGLGFLNKDNHFKLQDLRRHVGGLLWKFYLSF